MASGRILRWALMLGATTIEFATDKGSKIANADALSRLPLPVADCEVLQPAEFIHLHGTPVDHASLQFADQSLDGLRSDTIQGEAVGTGGMARVSQIAALCQEEVGAQRGGLGGGCVVGV